MSLPAFKRADDDRNAVVCIKRHIAAPIPRDTCCKPATPAPALELGDVSARPVDMHGLRRVLPQRWGEVCRRHFRNSLERAVYFDTDEKTARNWLHDKHAPASAFVLRAIAAFPDAMPCLFEGDC